MKVICQCLCMRRRRSVVSRLWLEGVLVMLLYLRWKLKRRAVELVSRFCCAACQSTQREEGSCPLLSLERGPKGSVVLSGPEVTPHRWHFDTLGDLWRYTMWSAVRANRYDLNGSWGNPTSQVCAVLGVIWKIRLGGTLCMSKKF